MIPFGHGYTNGPWLRNVITGIGGGRQLKSCHYFSSLPLDHYDTAALRINEKAFLERSLTSTQSNILDFSPGKSQGQWPSRSVFATSHANLSAATTQLWPVRQHLADLGGS